MPSGARDDEGDQQHADHQHVHLAGDGHGHDLLQVPRSSAPITGPSQCAVPPIIGMAERRDANSSG